MNQTFQYDETAIFVTYLVTFGLPLGIAISIGLWGIIGSVMIIIYVEDYLSYCKKIMLVIISVIFNIFGFILGIYVSIVYISPYILVEDSTRTQVSAGRFMMVQTGMCVVGVSTFLCGIIGMGVYLLFEYNFKCFGRILEVYGCNAMINCLSKWEYIFTGKEKKSGVTELKSNSKLTMT